MKHGNIFLNSENYLPFLFVLFFLHQTDLRTLFHWFLFINLSIKLYISRLNYYSSRICILIFMLIYTLITRVGNANSKLKNITIIHKSLHPNLCSWRKVDYWMQVKLNFLKYRIYYSTWTFFKKYVIGEMGMNGTFLMKTFISPRKTHEILKLNVNHIH